MIKNFSKRQIASIDFEKMKNESIIGLLKQDK